MSARPSISKMIRTVQKLGLKVTEIAVAPDGSIRLLTSNDNEGADAAGTAWNQYRARKAQRTTQGH
ncbi:hypothetical protein [Brevundimonas albigilva]|uniref:Uncharacterized protein n=1 Tax=Brevundimonas albigilva TaxID=1312364 RepID=A0ABY4SP85_9CAUL|nr:hypothetical protein [Brevundimonas albigilva]URI15930.1 hypothetical protein M8231_02760 [Brevundimonas albigilva]